MKLLKKKSSCYDEAFLYDEHYYRYMLVDRNYFGT